MDVLLKRSIDKMRLDYNPSLNSDTRYLEFVSAVEKMDLKNDSLQKHHKYTLGKNDMLQCTYGIMPNGACSINSATYTYVRISTPYPL